MNRLFCFGLGYVARALGETLIGAGWRVAGTSRGADEVSRLAGEGFEAFRFDRERPLDDARAALADATHMLISVPPDEGGDPVLDHHAADLARVESLAWIGYLSTTGVYGDRRGAWVDEDSEVAPSGDRAARRVAAEQGWLGLWETHGLPVHLFRLAGIYGPGRNQLEAAREGRARRVDKPGQVFSRIHVADIVQVLRASIARPDPGAVYNVCDDEAAPPQDVVACACALLGREPPPLVPFDKAELSPLARSFYADSKRVRNERIKRDLGVRLIYPTYREGLKALHDAEG